MSNRKIIITKTSQRRLDPSTMKSQVNHITIRMLGADRSKKWLISTGFQDMETLSDGRYLYPVQLTVKRIGRAVSDEIADRQYAEMLDIGQAAGNSNDWVFPHTRVESGETRNPFEPEKPASGEPNAPASGERNSPPVTERPAQREYTKMPPRTSLENYFDHIYEREAQIQVAHSAITAFVESDYNNRFHAVLYGEPACGKTEILRSFSKMLGPNSVLELDATSTTKAGAERILLESANLPPILVCEEIEKTDEASLRWLLGVLDHRGEIRKTTFGGGLRHRDVKMLCLATVNDMPLFKRVMDGALASRFSHKIYCPRPSKGVLMRILAREIAKIAGNEAWIQPAVDWCVDKEGSTDPRRAITVCLSGKDRLLDGSYQELLEKVSGPKDYRA